MDRSSIEALVTTSEKIRRDPEKARVLGSPAIARLRDGLRCEVAGLKGENIATDMPPAVGGVGSAVNPGWLLRAALASCEATVIAIRAAQTDIVLKMLEVEVTSESDLRGMLGVDDFVPAAFSKFKVTVRIGADGVDGERLRELVEWGANHAPVMDTLLHPALITSEVEIV